MSRDKRSHDDRTPEEKAAHAGDGQDQEPKQSRRDSSSLWDTDEHSDAPGPFGTGGG
ncbi:MAG TPA: hypothetical protein VEX39_07935 [Thermoleophilaceae bacterium]|nr:hypothetical protein [Thermoleophilaceae bacterium]